MKKQKITAQDLRIWIPMDVFFVATSVVLLLLVHSPYSADFILSFWPFSQMTSAHILVSLVTFLTIGTLGLRSILVGPEKNHIPIFRAQVYLMPILLLLGIILGFVPSFVENTFVNGTMHLISILGLYVSISNVYVLSQNYFQSRGKTKVYDYQDSLVDYTHLLYKHPSYNEFISEEGYRYLGYQPTKLGFDSFKLVVKVFERKFTVASFDWVFDKPDYLAHFEKNIMFEDYVLIAESVGLQPTKAGFTIFNHLLLYYHNAEEDRADSRLTAELTKDVEYEAFLIMAELWGESPTEAGYQEFISGSS